MSETARHFLEQRVPELEDLFKKGLFSKEEIKEIVAKRTQFEHKIKRHGCFKEDFLAYIDYECGLEVTRKQRYRDLNIKDKHTISDHSIVKYILSLYRRALVKFKADVSLWEAYVQFGKDSKSAKSVPKILASALQLHPGAISLWISSADWEFSHNNNPAASRTLYQRAIRLNRDSKPLWLAYFRMECEIVARLIKGNVESGSGEHSATNPILCGAIPITVFKHAAKETGMNATDAFDFHCASSAIPEALPVTEFLDEFVEANMSDHHRYQLLKARKIAQNIAFDDDNFSEKLQSCMILLGSAINNEHGPENISETVGILTLIFDSVGENMEFAKVIYDKISKIISGSLAKMLLPPALFIKWIDLAVKMNDSKAVPKILELAFDLYPSNDAILDLAVGNRTHIHEKKLYDACVKAIESCSNEATLLVEKVFGNNLLKEDMKASLGSLAISNVFASEQVLAHVLERQTLEEVYRQICGKHVAPRFVTCLLNVLIRKSLYDRTSFSVISKIAAFSDAIYSDVECGLMLAKFAFLSGEIDFVSRLYAKITATLPNPDRFLFEFECMKDSICS